MGMIVDVFRRLGSDCTNGGISAAVNELLVLNIDGPWKPNMDNLENLRWPVVLLVRNTLGTVRIVPARRDGNTFVQVKNWTMFGGNFAYTSDSRFHNAVAEMTGHPSYGAVPIHDRIE